MNAGRGTFVAFATSPGRTASDNSGGRNGLFTQYFLEALRQPGLGLDDVFNVVRERVDQSSGGKQLPWTQSAVVGRFAFVANGAGNPKRDDAAGAGFEGTWTWSGDWKMSDVTWKYRFSLQISRSGEGFTGVWHEDWEYPDNPIAHPGRQIDVTLRLRLDGERLSGGAESASGRHADGSNVDSRSIELVATFQGRDRLNVGIVWRRNAQGKEISGLHTLLEKRP